MQKLLCFVAGSITILALLAVCGLVFIKTSANGFSARSHPSAIEAFAARTARDMALPRDAKEKRNPITNSAEVLKDAREHWADHCAVCHANDGSGDITMGRQLYPPAPDMRKERTQRMSDGELFYIIENGIRMSGMPAWGSGRETDAQDSWKLVHFIRHLPNLSPGEIKEMEKLNPKSPADLEEEKQEEEFLKGKTPTEAPKEHHHH
ncbi:MAG TPA: c-type cytochrome [Bryobacteraceae bacterium]|nr:c-type cytochrome [Bryobacteraceae bacterium]